MATAQSLSTANELWQWSQQFPDKQFELWEGIITEVTPTGGESSNLGHEIGVFFSNHIRKHNLGYVFGADGSFELAPKVVLIPDAAFVSKTRLPRIPKGYIPVAPDLAVEVVSPTDSIKKVQRKALKYLQYGTKIVWIVYPEDKTVDVYSLTADGKVTVDEIDIDGVLDGGDVLPDFKLPVRDIFNVLEDQDTQE